MIVTQTQAERAENYSVHFNCRQMFKALDTDTQQRIKNVCEVMREPNLSMFGNDDYTEKEYRCLIDLANQNGIMASMCLIWYTSDKAWDNFQVLWQNLPEPESIRHTMYCDPVDN